MAALRTFSLQGCTITFGGFTITGFAPDDAITMEPSNESFEEVVGADGDLSMAQKAVTWKVKVSLSQTSKTNDSFSAIHTADLISGTGVLPFAFIDPRGSSAYALTAARIKGFPTAAHGTSVKTREWNISGVGIGFVGGN